MLERETELIKQIIVESTINARDAIKVNEVLAAAVPRGVKAFVLGQVTRLLEDDLRQSSRLAQITRGVAPTVTAERTLLRSLATEYVLDRNEFLKLIEDTVHFLENYLCRPQWTLMQLMFEKQPEISLQELARKFELVVDYAYYGNLVERHVRRQGWTCIRAEHFQELIARIDTEVVKQHSPRELALLTRPIYEFLLFGEVTMNRPIPLGAVLLFYDDKKATGVKEYIERICYVRSRKQLSMNELIGIIEDLYQVETTVKIEFEKSDQEILSRNSAHEPTTPELDETHESVETHIDGADGASNNADALPEESVNETAAPDTQPATAPLAEQPAKNVMDIDAAELAHDVPHPDVVPPSIINADALAEYATEREAQKHALYLTFPERPAVSNSRELTVSVAETLSDDQRAMFVRNVFGNDENAYVIFMASINKAQNWREAQIHLRELFEMNKLDILSPDVVAFTDAMHAYYEPALKKVE